MNIQDKQTLKHLIRDLANTSVMIGHYEEILRISENDHTMSQTSVNITNKILLDYTARKIEVYRNIDEILDKM